MTPKILIETNDNIDEHIERVSDLININRFNFNNLFEHWIVVLEKYALLFTQLHEWRWVFINTIFSFLLKLNSDGYWIYYKQLHNKFVVRFLNYIRDNNIKIYLYQYDQETKDYLDVWWFEYQIFDTRGELIKAIVRENDGLNQTTLF